MAVPVPPARGGETCLPSAPGREPLHIAELVQRALRESGRTGPETLATANGGGPRAGMAAAVAGAGAATALVALAARHRR